MALEKYERKYDIKFKSRRAVLVSAPKCGRTWLRMMLARILQLKRFDLSEYEMVFSVHWRPGQVQKRLAKDMRVLYLYRDPRDAVVSYFHEQNGKDISRFIRNSSGINWYINYFNQWSRHLALFPAHLAVSYEDLREDPVTILHDILFFLNVDVGGKEIEGAVEYSKFKNMQKIELGGEENLLAAYKGKFGKNREAVRVRRGKVGGFKDELDKEDIEFLNQECKRLSSTLYARYGGKA